MIRYSKRTEIRRRRTMTAITAVVLASGFFTITANADAVPFIEFKRTATVSDLVSVAKAAESGSVPENQNGIRYDINIDGVVNDRDVELLGEYICMELEFNSIIDEVSDEAVEVLDLFSMEICDTYMVSQDDFTLEIATWSIADGGYTGYAVSDEPYTGDILYNFPYESGDIILITKLTYGSGARWDEFDFGNVSEFGLDYVPRPEVVERAIANIDRRCDL